MIILASYIIVGAIYAFVVSTWVDAETYRKHEMHWTHFAFMGLIWPVAAILIAYFSYKDKQK